VRYSWALLEAILRLLRDKLEKAVSEKDADREKAVRRRAFLT